MKAKQLSIIKKGRKNYQEKSKTFLDKSSPPSGTSGKYNERSLCPTVPLCQLILEL